MSHLSTALATYYKRCGNRIIFRNGDTLNALSFKICDAIHQPGFDAAALSRVVKGTRLFTKRQLTSFCSILFLSKDERDALFRAMAKDILDRYSITRATLHKKGAYAKFLEYAVREEAVYIGSEHALHRVGADDSARLARKVLHTLRRALHRRQSVWKAQRDAMMAIVTYREGYASFFLFQPDRR